MRMVARLIDRGDEAYWPILERLEAERDNYLSRRERLRTYLRPQSKDAFSKIRLVAIKSNHPDLENR